MSHLSRTKTSLALAAALLAVLGVGVWLSRGCHPSRLTADERLVMQAIDDAGGTAEGVEFGPHDNGDLVVLVKTPGRQSGPRALIWQLKDRDPHAALRLLRCRYTTREGQARDELFLVEGDEVRGWWPNPAGAAWLTKLRGHFTD